MASDRRKSNSRRSSDRRADSDRRVKQDRRTKNSRRNVGTSSSDKTSDTGNSSGFSIGDFFKGLLKKLAVLFTLLVFILTIALIYFFVHLEYYMGKIGKNVSIQMTKAQLDAESLTDKTTKARVFFEVTNSLPFDIRFHAARLNALLGDYIIAKGVQALPGKRIKAGASSIVAISFYVDSIMTRRGLQKAVKQNSKTILTSLVERVQGGNKAITGNLKGILKVQGMADLKLLVSGVEIPFTLPLAL